MKREPVESRMITSVGYDTETQTLEVEFQDGAVWQYKNVPEDEYNTLMSASSKGSYMQDLIIGVYPEIQIERRSR